ncbi:hypothetical protein [Candidatus Ruminimicrobium bovinum]|uniref:hypothetical protein n=1 Tax=Candidatus Ruminimicrobium bovinum TaxID=3242779 RepID=UPI0039B92B95
MIKKILMVCSILFFVNTIYAQNDFFVKFFTQRLDISVQEDDVQRYYDSEDVPELLYGSKIISTGMAVISIFNSDFILKQGQGLLIAKDPVTGEILVYNLDSSKEGKIGVTLNKYSATEMSQGSIFAFSRIGNTLKLKLVCGDLTVIENGITSTLYTGDCYYYKN